MEMRVSECVSHSKGDWLIVTGFCHVCLGASPCRCPLYFEFKSESSPSIGPSLMSPISEPRKNYLYIKKLLAINVLQAKDVE